MVHVVVELVSSSFQDWNGSPIGIISHVFMYISLFHTHTQTQPSPHTHTHTHKHTTLPTHTNTTLPTHTNAHSPSALPPQMHPLPSPTPPLTPGMIAAMTRHLKSLRYMQRDHGWIHTLLEEAENERMHLLTAMVLRNPGPIFKASVIGTQGA